MSKKKDYGMTEEEIRREHEERLQDSNDEYWLTPINEDKTLSELGDDLYYKQAKAEEVYWEEKHLEQLEMEPENVEKDLEDEELDFGEEELDIGDIELEVLSKGDDTIKRDKEYAAVKYDEELEI